MKYQLILCCIISCLAVNSFAMRTNQEFKYENIDWTVWELKETKIVNPTTLERTITIQTRDETQVRTFTLTDQEYESMKNIRKTATEWFNCYKFSKRVGCGLVIILFAAGLMGRLTCTDMCSY